MGKNVFISRDLDENSPFRGMLEAQGVSVSGESLITIRQQPFENVPRANWIFFYSKNGVFHFLDQLSESQKEILPSQIATIGPGTAKALDRWGIRPTFIGNGDAVKTAEMFAEIALGQIVLFPRAMNSRRSVQAELDDKIQAIDLIVYANEIKENVQKRDEAILVFTSPMNAETYFRLHTIQKGQRVLAIGSTTASRLKSLGVTDFIISKIPSEEELAQTILEIC